MMVYFKGFIVYEVGLCMFDVVLDVLKVWGVGLFLFVGVSLDGLIIMVSGECFVVEVKNLSSFC